MIKLLSFFIILSFFACAPHRIPRKDLPYSRNFPENNYRVKKGDSLWKIAREYRVSVDELMRENKIRSPQELKSGRLIRIPRYGKAGKITAFRWPVKGKIINFFGEKINDITNKGLNIETEEESIVKASAEGKVVFAGYLKGWGQTLIIKHRKSFYTVYANIRNISVRQGERIRAGEIIGKLSSCSGNPEGNCVFHFEIRNGHIPENPLIYLGQSAS